LSKCCNLKKDIVFYSIKHIKYYYLFFILLFSSTVNAQLETKNWFIYQNRIAVTPSGVVTGLSLPANGTFPISYKSASVSDAVGNLLLAFNGNTIIDKNMNIMPVLVNVNFGASNSKMQIQQVPGTSKYYVFYANPNSQSGNINSKWILKYALVDLSLNSGNGDVITYNQVIDTSSSPAFTLVQGEDPSKAWLVTHRWRTDSFFVYPITSAGLGTTPVISKAGTNATLTDYIFRDLKTSYNGKMVGGITYSDYTTFFATLYSHTEVFNFNAITGTLNYKVRTPRRLTYFYSYLSLEFSPDNKLLYEGIVSRVYGLQPCGFGSSLLQQYNLCYSDSLDFEKYKATVASEFFFCAPSITWGNIQMGADKRIHMPFSGVTVPTLNFPNRIGTSSNYVFNSYQLPNQNYSYVAVPDFHHKLMEKAIKNNISYSGGCYPNPTFFTITNDTIANIQWNFGDPASSNNVSTAFSPSHVFSTPGFYTVTAQLYTTQNIFIETVSELVEIKNPGKRLLYDWPADTTLCQGDKINIRLNVVNGIFHWYQKLADGTIYNSTTSDVMQIDYTGTYYVEMKQNDCNGCTMLDSITVTILPKPNFSLGPDRTLCQGDSVLLDIYDPAATFLWSNGSIANSIWVKQGGLYWVEAEYNNNGCPARDSIRITEVPGVLFSLPDDTTLCNNQTLLLSPGVSNASYFWQNGTTQQQFTVSQPGTYWVKITSANGCAKSDTINVSYVNAQQVYLGNDTSLCNGNMLTLKADVNNVQYLWSNGAVSQSITVSQTGKYWVRAYNGFCTVSDTINVNFNAPPVVNLGKDTTICENKNLLLNPNISIAQFLWQNGSQLPVYNVTQPGTYWVMVKKDGCVVRDTININFYQVPVINLGPDTRFCSGDSLRLDAGIGFSSYNWNTGSAISYSVIHLPGQYHVTGITVDGCASKDTIQILPLYSLPVINLGPDGGVCIGTGRLLAAGNGFSSYKWNTGSTLPNITVTNTGNYWVKVQDQFGCKGTDTIIITSILPRPVNFLPADTAICAYETINIKSLLSFNEFLWNTGAFSSAITITKPGIYWLEVKDYNKCSGRDTIKILPRDCITGVYFPTAFTPNNDGKNDDFKPLVFGLVEKYNFTVFNRYGQVVFQSNLPGRGWDGKFGGMLQNCGTYTWVCYYQFQNLMPKTEKGTIVLIR
jgi:gliding motility-associated-like protein